MFKFFSEGDYFKHKYYSIMRYLSKPITIVSTVELFKNFSNLVLNIKYYINKKCLLYFSFLKFLVEIVFTRK